MTPEQQELIQHVIYSLKNPRESMYSKMRFKQAADLLAAKLDLVRIIDQRIQYERAMRAIK